MINKYKYILYLKFYRDILQIRKKHAAETRAKMCPVHEGHILRKKANTWKRRRKEIKQQTSSSARQGSKFLDAPDSTI